MASSSILDNIKSEDMRFRVSDLTEYSARKDPRELGHLVEDLPPEGNAMV